MGIREKARKIMGSKSKEKFSCEQGQEGKIHCASFRELGDGTRTTLAEIDYEFTGDCIPVATRMDEHESGALDKLEKKSVPRMQQKCKGRRPQDY